MILGLFSYAYHHLYIFFSEVSVQTFWPCSVGLFICKLMRFKSSLNILDMSSTRYTCIFSQLVAYLLILSTVSFTEKAFNFNKVKHISFSFMHHLLVLYLKCHHQIQGYLDFILCCCGEVLVLCFIFKFMIHF